MRVDEVSTKFLAQVLTVICISAEKEEIRSGAARLVEGRRLLLMVLHSLPGSAREEGCPVGQAFGGN